jgi:hypothetical protein
LHGHHLFEAPHRVADGQDGEGAHKVFARPARLASVASGWLRKTRMVSGTVGRS